MGIGTESMVHARIMVDVDGGFILSSGLMAGREAFMLILAVWE